MNDARPRSKRAGAKRRVARGARGDQTRRRKKGGADRPKSAEVVVESAGEDGQTGRKDRRSFTLPEDAAATWRARTALNANERLDRWFSEHGQSPAVLELFVAVNRADQLALRAIAVANALADPSTASEAVGNAKAWIDRLHTLDELKHDTLVWTAFVEAMEEALAIRRKLSTGRQAPAPGSPPPPSLQSLAKWVPAKVTARIPWARYVDWLQDNTDAIERTMTLCERRLDWRALDELARESGVQPPEWSSVKALRRRRRPRRPEP